MKRRIGKNDWALIREAIQMLLTDYEEGHPNQKRLEQLEDEALRRSETATKRRESLLEKHRRLMCPRCGRSRQSEASFCYCGWPGKRRNV